MAERNTKIADGAKSPIEGLVETCLAAHRASTPDRETEMVVADWCEEHGLRGIANAVRTDDVNVRWAALAHLWRAIDATFWISTTKKKKTRTKKPTA